MSSHYVSSLLAGRPSDDQATTDFDDFNLVESTDMVDSGGGLSGENKRRFLSVLIDAASSSSNGAASLSPVNASFAIRCISGAMVDQGLVCGGIIGGTNKPTTTCLKPDCDVTKHKTVKDTFPDGKHFYLTRSGRAYMTDTLNVIVPNALVDRDLFDKVEALLNEVNSAYEDAPKSLGLDGAVELFEEFKKLVLELVHDSGEESEDGGRGNLTHSNNQSNIEDNSGLAAIVTSMQAAFKILEANNIKLENALTTATEDLNILTTKISSQNRQIAELESKTSSSTGGFTQGYSKAVEKLSKEVLGLKHEMLLQDSRLQSTSIVFGKRVIRSPADMILFVNDHFRLATFGCHYDWLATVDSLHPDDISSKDYADVEHSAHKSKFLNISEITTGASFQRLVPLPFGGSSGSSMKNHSIAKLANIKDRSNWWSQGGTEGLKHALETELAAKEIAIVEEAELIHGEELGAVLAIEFNKRNSRFGTGFFSWTESFYMELVGLTQGVTEKEAWDLILHCWLAMFTDMRKVRASCANNSVAGLDADSTLRKERVAKYVWAMGQCIQIQDDYLDKGFRGHPTISSVINQHLFKYRVPLSVHQASEKIVLKKLEDINTWKGKFVRQVESLEKKVEKK